MWSLLCLAPVLFVGYGATIEKSSRSTDLSSMAIEVRSCEGGLGAYGRFQESGLYAGGITYGLRYEGQRWSLGVAPHVGISYVDHPVRELPMRTQFDVGGAVSVGYDDWRVQLEYSHQSNAGLRDTPRQPNVGHDGWYIMFGRAF